MLIVRPAGTSSTVMALQSPVRTCAGLSRRIHQELDASRSAWTSSSLLSSVGLDPLIAIMLCAIVVSSPAACECRGEMLGTRRAGESFSGEFPDALREIIWLMVLGGQKPPAQLGNAPAPRSPPSPAASSGCEGGPLCSSGYGLENRLRLNKAQNL